MVLTDGTWEQRSSRNELHLIGDVVAAVISVSVCRAWPAHQSTCSARICQLLLIARHTEEGALVLLC